MYGGAIWDFEGLAAPLAQFGRHPTKASAKKPLVYFGSFPDPLGCDAAGNIKPRTNDYPRSSGT